MAKVNVENLSEEMLAGTRDTANGPQVSFFSLKDGEEAIVRILISNYADFDIHTVHNVKMEGYQYGRRMNCLRQPTDPIEMCPLCAAQQKLEQKIYIHMIQYTVEGDRVVPHAKVWERSILDRGFGVNALKTYLSNYGDLSEMVCKITRSGAGLNTNYTFIPNLNPVVYRPDIYVKDTSLFDNWSPLGIAIMNKTAEEYNVFLATGSFPQTQNNNNSNNYSNTNAQVTARTYNNSTNSPVTSSYQPSVNQTQANIAPSTPTYVPAATTPDNATPVYEAPAQPSATPFAPNQPVGEVPYGGQTAAPANMPWNNPSTTGGFERPRRY